MKSLQLCRKRKTVKDTFFGEQWCIKVPPLHLDTTNFASTFLMSGLNLMTNMWARSQERLLMVTKREGKFAVCFTEDLFWYATTRKYQFLTLSKIQFRSSRKSSKEISTRQGFFRCCIRKVSHFSYFSRLRWNFVQRTNINFCSNLFIMP